LSFLAACCTTVRSETLSSTSWIDVLWQELRKIRNLVNVGRYFKVPSKGTDIGDVKNSCEPYLALNPELALIVEAILWLMGMIIVFAVRGDVIETFAATSGQRVAVWSETAIFPRFTLVLAMTGA